MTIKESLGLTAY